jgi:hypothetical protein
VFQGPRRVDTTKLVHKPTPAAWRSELKETEVSVLSLVKDPARTYQPGWISYRSYMLDSPEVEIICGGLNEKDLKGAALWRQGHLLHFAFDLAPAEMNETGQALLLNSIAYIARFAEDRPIARTPSAWAEKEDAPRSRRRAAVLFASSIPADRDLDFIFNPATKVVVGKMDRLSYPKWYKENSPFLACDKDGKLMVDSTAKELGIPFDQLDFFPKTIEKLGVSANANKARQLLKRYAPEGPADGSDEEWVKWWQTNRPYLFFSEQGGYRWYLDPLAKHRGIPSEKLQGPARATAN